MNITFAALNLSLALVFVLIVVYYQRRQAKALDFMAYAERERLIQERKGWRAEQASHIAIGQPLNWLVDQAEVLFDLDLEPIEVRRKVDEFAAVDIAIKGGKRLVVTTVQPRKLHQNDWLGWLRSGTKKQLKRAVGETPLLGRSRFGHKSASLSVIDDEWLDVKARSAGEQLRVDWGDVDELFFVLV
jgi:hypothetical protein